MTSVLSVDDGEIVYAGRMAHGYGLIINHNNGWASHYKNLEAIVAIRTDIHRPKSQYVRAGNVIGYVGAPEAGAFKRLYFELWELDRARQFVPVDPREHLARWPRKREYDHFTPAPPKAQKEAA
jgi:murein DD-endopeptidase MepM/ murein hydrolase activator NlpD